MVLVARVQLSGELCSSRSLEPCTPRGPVLACWTLTVGVQPIYANVHAALTREPTTHGRGPAPGQDLPVLK